MFIVVAGVVNEQRDDLITNYRERLVMSKELIQELNTQVST